MGIQESAARIGMGVIGAGNFARLQHLPNISRIDKCRLRAVCDLDSDLAKTVGRHFGADYSTADYNELLKDDTIDAVVIAVRDDLQATLTIAALEAGKHVYVEKPLAERPADISPIIDAEARSDRRVVVGFNKRYAPINRQLKEIAQSHGGARNLQLRMTDDAWRWAKNYPPGHLLKLDVCHHFDLVRWITDAEITSVYCVSSRPDDDSVMVTLSNGAIATIMFSGHGTMDMPKEVLHVITERGGMTAEDFVELRTYGYLDAEHIYRFPGHSNPDHEFMHKYLLEHLGSDGLRSIRRTTWQLRQRLESGQLEGAVDEPEVKRYVERTIPNFLRDQGWLESLKEFVKSIVTGGKTTHATVHDAFLAASAVEAAIESRSSRRVVDLTD